MKIIFAGTSHGIPEKDRFCSATFVGVGKRWYIIDAGAPISPLILRYGIAHRDVRGIFITHQHGDHFDGLPAFCIQIGWYYLDASPDIFLPTERGEKMLRYWVREGLQNEAAADGMKLHVYGNGPVYRDDAVEILAAPTRHLADSHAFLLRAEGKTVLFSGDMGENYAEFPELFGGVHSDLAVCECAHNTTFTDCFPTLARTDTARLVVNHIAPAKLGDAEARKGELPFPVTFAHDGLTVEL